MNLSKTIPPKPALVLDRERLVNKLDGWEEKKLIVIHAQAGQGKSTLAAGYAAALDSPWVWYNMDREDDNPAVFLTSLGQAIRQTCPDCVPHLPPISQNRYGFSGMRQSISRWTAQVFGDLPRPLLVVFDDLNNTSEPPALQQVLKTLIEVTPPQVRFMIISRTQPNLEIARLRAKQAVGELTGNDLRFSDQETHELFNTIFGMEIGRNEAETINRTAEGWPAGLVLMHEYLATAPPHERPASLIGRRPEGFHAHVFDYLAQEVFTHLPRDMQSFLMRTSIVDELTLPVMRLISGLPSEAATAAMIKELRQRNLFVTTADAGAMVVRYHALFREFLQRKLISLTTPQEVKRLHTAAADYYLKNNARVRAVDVYLASGQFEKAVKLIETIGRELIASGQTQTVLRWIQSLPLEYAEHPWLLFYKAIAFRFTDPRTALSFFELALAGFRAENARGKGKEGQMLTLAGIIEACFYAGGNFKRMERAAATAATLLRQNKREPAETRARLLLAMGTAYFFIGRLREGSDALQQALELFRKSRNHFYQIQSAIYLAPCSIYLGDFKQAREAVRKGFDALASIPDEAGGEAALHMAQAMTALFEGNFTEAQEAIDACHNLAHEYDLEAFDFLSLDIGGWLKVAVGDYQNAEALLTRCKRKSEELRNAFFGASSTHLLAISYLHRNKLERALAEAEYATAIRSRSGSKLFSAVSLSGMGAIRLKQGKLSQAEKELNGALKMFQQIGAAQQQANVHLLLAKLNFRRKKPEDARKHLQAGFRLGQERGFTYYYLVSAEELAELASAASAAGIFVDYCETLLRSQVPARTAPLLNIYCFGGFTVKNGDTTIRDAAWRSRRAKTLVKLLVAHDGQKLPRDLVMELLWPGSGPDVLPQTFNSLLHRIRQLLDPDGTHIRSISCILQEENLLSLNSNRVWTDVGQFLAHLEAAGKMKAQNNPKKVLEQYEKAVALYRGDFLPTDLYDDWASQVRDRLRGLYFKVLEDAAGLSEASGDKDKATAFYGTLFNADPCNEKACRELMTRQGAEGRRNEAMRTYERCQMALRKDLDAEPDAQTARLYKNIIGG